MNHFEKPQQSITGTESAREIYAAAYHNHRCGLNQTDRRLYVLFPSIDEQTARTRRFIMRAGLSLEWSPRLDVDEYGWPRKAVPFIKRVSPKG